MVAPRLAAMPDPSGPTARLRTGPSWGAIAEPLATASLAFLTLLVVGAVLLIALKLQYPDFGAGASPIEILDAVAIIALALLRVPVHIDGLVVSVLPLGGLVAVALGFLWARRSAPRGDNGPPPVFGALVGVIFGILCSIAALVFRYGGPGEVHAGAWGALLWGTLWGSAFATVAELARRRSTAFDPRPWFGPGTRGWRRGVAAGVVSLAVAGAVAAALGLVWVIVTLLRGGPGPRFGVGEATAALAYLTVFAPNAVVTLTALGMGAPVYIGSRVTIAGAGVGSVRRVWLGGGSSWFLWVLVLIPAVACIAGGYWARLGSAGSPRVVIGTQAVVFGSVLGVLALLGEARLGAAILGRGLARLDVNALATFVLGVVWGIAGGTGGWLLAQTTRPREEVA